MIQIKLLPDGGSDLPIEAKDHSILADKLVAADPPDHSPAPSWRDIERVVTDSHILLRIEGTLDDYASGALDGFATAVANINGLKKHPDGWVEVDEGSE
jgi:hypothetical protein